MEKPFTMLWIFYTRHLDLTAKSVPMSVLIARLREEFRRRLNANETSKRYAESMEDALRKLEAVFGDRIVSAITAGEIKDWLFGLRSATKTRNNLRGYTHRVFKFATDLGYCESNPVKVIEKFYQRASKNQKISVLTAGDTEKLLYAADPEIIPFLTISFCAGVRRATLDSPECAGPRSNGSIARTSTSLTGALLCPPRRARTRLATPWSLPDGGFPFPGKCAGAEVRSRGPRYDGPSDVEQFGGYKVGLRNPARTFFPANSALSSLLQGQQHWLRENAKQRRPHNSSPVMDRSYKSRNSSGPFRKARAHCFRMGRGPESGRHI
jgi:hypothetical protein